jgi:hypothetical protein
LPGDAECDEPYFFRGGEGKRAKLTASELAKEKNPAMAAAQFINATTDVMRA